MQSLRQYQSLERRLRQTVRGSPNGQPTGVITVTSSHRSGKQDPGSLILVPEARQVEDLEKQDLNPLDFQIAITPNVSSTINGTNAREGISTQASTIGLDSLNDTAYTLDSATTLPQSVTGIGVQKKEPNLASEDSVIYVVELGDDDNDINPQRWGRAFKIWATYVNLSMHNSFLKSFWAISNQIGVSGSWFTSMALLSALPPPLTRLC